MRFESYWTDMRRAVLLLLVAGVLRCGLARPGAEPFNESRSNLEERGVRLQEEDSLHLQDDNNIDEVEEEVTEDERNAEGDQEDEDATEDGSANENGEGTEDQDEVEDVAVDNDVNSGNDDGDGSKTAVSDKTTASTLSPESKILQTGNKKRRTKNSGPSKKMASKLLPLLMIPLMIQAQLIPMMLMKLKFMALKALMLGKAALVIILLNLLRNSLLGADSMEEQYEQQTLASNHYGYSGGPEYGAWINKRVYKVHPNGPYRGHQFMASPGNQDTTSRTVLLDPATGPSEENA